jgi:hypothetical protein
MTGLAVRLLSVCLLLLWGVPILAEGSPPAARAPRKFAVLIAVTELKYTPSRSLKGPANDVSHLRDLLVDRFGFAPDDILTVEKQAATKAGLIRAIETQLVARSQPGDLCLLYYSGHGTQVADQAPLDEAEGLDEALVPYDANITHGLRLDSRKACDGIGCEGDKCDGGDPVPETLLLDDQLNVLLGRIKTNNVVVLLDACHSGTATRGGAVDKRWVRAKAIDKTNTTGSVAASDDLGGDLLEPTVLTAAASNQTAKDWPFLAEQRAAAGQADGASSNSNDNMGAFTYFLLEALQSQENSTYRQVMDHIAARLTAREFTQTPQLEGRGLDRLFLSVAAAAPTPASDDGAFGPFRVPGPTQARIVSREEKTVHLRAVGGRSLSAGSIFSEGTTAVQVGMAAASGGLESGAALLGGSAAPGQVLIERFRRMKGVPLRVAVTGAKIHVASLEAALRTASAGNDTFRIVAATEARDCDLDVTGTGAGGSITITPYRNQQRLNPVISTSTAAAVAALMPLIEKLSATLLLSRLENSSAEFAIDVRVNGKEAVEVRIDDSVTFTARASRECYLYLVDIDPAGKITVLFPNRFTASNRIAAGKLYNMPLPDVYRLRVQGPEGPEIIKAIATTAPLHLGVFADDKGDFAPLSGRAGETAQAILRQLRQGINAAEPAVPIGVDRTDLIATSGWAASSAYLRVMPKSSK